MTSSLIALPLAVWERDGLEGGADRGGSSGRRCPHAGPAQFSSLCPDSAAVMVKRL